MVVFKRLSLMESHKLIYLFRNFSVLQVAAATGQPLLAPAPIQHVIQYPQAHHQHHFQPPYQTQVVRMYHPQETPHQGNTVQYLAPTPPSTTPSPGQSHQQYHAGPQQSQGQGPTPTYAPPQGHQLQLVCPIIPQSSHHQTIPFVYQGHTPHPQQIQILMSQQQHSAQ